MSRSISPADLRALAERAARLGCRILHEQATGAHFCTSERDPDTLFRVTGLSCTCPTFVAQGYCLHHATLLAHHGWLPEDDDPDPSSPAPSRSSAPPTTPEMTSANGSTTWLSPASFPGAGIELTSTAPVRTETVVEPDLPAPVVPITLAGAEDRAAAMTSTIDTAVERLAAQLERGYTAEFRDFLRFMGRFHQYSYANACLIKAQCPEATLVAGLRKWADMGYRVRKGERAIWIWAPIFRKVEDEVTGEVVEKLVGFRPATVFDAGQLENVADKPFPTPFRPLPDDAHALYRTVRDRIVEAGIAIEERRLPHGTEGVSRGGLILVNSALDSRRRLFVLLHELAHELGHRGPERTEVSREQLELEAESVAFVVASALGLESPHSADYLLNWHGTAEQLKASLGQIQKLAKQVLAIVLPDQSCARRAA
jgi:hypothetical protein